MYIRIFSGKINYFRFMVQKIKLNRTPIAAVVYLIFVDSGGYFFIIVILNRFLTNFDAMQRTGFHQLDRQFFCRPIVSPFRAIRAASFEHRSKLIESSPCRDRTDTTAVHADRITVFQQTLITE